MLTDTEENEVFLDARELVPCEPLTQSLKILSQLREGQYFHLLHRMIPHMLFQNLNPEEFFWFVQEPEWVGSSSLNDVHIYFCFKSDLKTQKHIQDHVLSNAKGLNSK